MAQMSRRELIGSAAAVGGVVATVKSDAFGETQQPPFGPTAACVGPDRTVASTSRTRSRLANASWARTWNRAATSPAADST